jgi:SAM-dependent methyltransferase
MNINIKNNNICPICKSKSNFIFNSKNDKNIFECINIDCGHFFTPPNNLSQGICPRGDDIETESDDYLRTYDERNTRLLKFLRNYLPIDLKKINFLDFGAGNAHVSRTFKSILKDNVNIYCLESNPLCKNLYSKYKLIQLDGVNEVPNHIDLIYMIEVIEHLVDPLEALNALNSKLSNTGHLFLSTPCAEANEKNTNAFDTPSHLHFFTERSLNMALEKCGFEPIFYKFISEMYPFPSKKLHYNLYYLVKNLLVKFLGFHIFNSKITHLVGITKPVLHSHRLNNTKIKEK